MGQPLHRFMCIHVHVYKHTRTCTRNFVLRAPSERPPMGQSLHILIRIYVHVHTRTHTHTFVLRAPSETLIYSCVSPYIYWCVHMYIWKYAHKHTFVLLAPAVYSGDLWVSPDIDWYVYIDMYICIYTHTHTHTFVCTRLLKISSTHGSVSHVTRMNQLCQTYIMSYATDMHESCHAYAWVMSHIWTNHVTHLRELCHTQECANVLDTIWGGFD